MKSKKFTVVYLGMSGFPYGLAESNKAMLISQALINGSINVTILCNQGKHKREKYPNMKHFGNYKGIEYIYTTRSFYKPSSNVKRYFQKITSAINELKFLFRNTNQKERNIRFAIVSTKSIWHVWYYSILARILKFKTILNYSEYPSAMAQHSSIKSNINNYLFDRFAAKLVNGILPISEFLVQHITKVAKSKPYLRIPVLFDFKKYKYIPVSSNENYILFCGHVAYYEIINFIIKSFETVANKVDFFLYLVLNGNSVKLKRIKDEIALSECHSRIKIFSSLSDRELFTNYINAKALLIPLRPTIQDKARFPHKIGGYLASGNPIITTNYGEIKNYFKDEIDALIADEFDYKLFAAKILFVFENPEKSKEIGKRGYELGLSEFNFERYTSLIIEYLKSL